MKVIHLYDKASIFSLYFIDGVQRIPSVNGPRNLPKERFRSNRGRRRPYIWEMNRIGTYHTIHHDKHGRTKGVAVVQNFGQNGFIWIKFV